MPSVPVGARGAAAGNAVTFAGVSTVAFTREESLDASSGVVGWVFVLGKAVTLFTSDELGTTSKTL